MCALPTPNFVIFTDLDGTLLDYSSYGWRAAGPALRLLRRYHVPLVVVTSKTRAEVSLFLRAIGRRDPFVVENGGAIYIPSGYFPFEIREAQPALRGWQRVALGSRHAVLRKALVSAAKRARVRVRGFGDMSAREISKLTGLKLAHARLARLREYDEPFLLEGADRHAWSRLRQEILRSRLTATRGTRFYHISGAGDKGRAVRLLIRWFRSAYGNGLHTVGLGDNPIDIPLLRQVDVPILVPVPGKRYDPETLKAVQGLQRAGRAGPFGWNRAVLSVLNGLAA
jgi:mannosyl-3-phosphoglycerate phosphatase